MRLYLFILLGLLCVGCSQKNEGCKVWSQIADDPTSPLRAVPVEAPGLPNLFKVSDDLYRSAQPEVGGMTSAKKLGIKTVISLRETELDRELNEKEQTGLNLIHLPIVTWNVRDENILDAMRAIRDAPKPILVHCRHGADRTGLTVAMYRIVYQGWEKSCAKQELVNGGFGYHAIWINIPKEIDNADIDAIRQILGVHP
ncbi:MAG: tyrosine-protein phosphatase [Proteobacteria bacterium]|nr:tyrosine-protein phosphatase [Pseudomonadota bacterium]